MPLQPRDWLLCLGTAGTWWAGGVYGLRSRWASGPCQATVLQSPNMSCCRALRAPCFWLIQLLAGLKSWCVAWVRPPCPSVCRGVTMLVTLDLWLFSPTTLSPTLPYREKGRKPLGEDQRKPAHCSLCYRNANYSSDWQMPQGHPESPESCQAAVSVYLGLL